VTGSRGPGSVANEVVRQSRRPVLLVRRAPTSHVFEAEQPGVASTEAALEPGAEAASQQSGFYELLPDPFAETEAGLLPHQHVGGQSGA
jgi:hypothetical protein